jgi:hypothetical protein
MLTLDLAVVFIIVVVAFAAAWRWMPAGWLTASTGSVSAIIVALYEAAAEQMPALEAALPEEYRPVLIILLLVLTVAARFRNRRRPAMKTCNTAIAGRELADHGPA